MFLYLIFLLAFALITIVLLIIWAVTKKSIFGKILGIIWIIIIGLLILSDIIVKHNSKILLEKKDFYGDYTIDRSFFSGYQSNWQYNHYRFEIKNNDSIYFYITENENILKIYRGGITTIKPYSSERLIINMANPTHHIISTNPTIYRDNHSFYIVFNSPKFGNIFFIKGRWTPLNK